VVARNPGLAGGELSKNIIRDIIDLQVGDVIATSAAAIAAAAPANAEMARRATVRLIRYGDELAAANRALREFLYANVYYHPRVAEVNRRACEMLRSVFAAYLGEPERLGESAARRIETEGLHRTVCDYIAGMTDRYLLEEYARLTG
jgi:dGTPase